MATLRHGMPVEICGLFQKQGTSNRFPRYLHLCDVVLSNAHTAEAAPTWYVNVLLNPMVPGPNLHEFLITLPTRTVSYFAMNSAQYTQWIFALDQVEARVIERYYSVGRVLGSGAFSTVRFVEDRETRDKFAVKEIDKQKAQAKSKQRGPPHNSAITGRLKEIEIMLNLRPHPNIVNTFDIFENLHHIYLVIEYMEGGELFDIIADNGHLSERNAAQVIKEIIVAVKYLHSNGIVHCDIKPENILCTTKSWPLNIKLCDFGLANIIHKNIGTNTNNNTNNTNANTPNHNNTSNSNNYNTNNIDCELTSMIGTPGYCAPEVVCKKSYGAPVDMWAIGVILYILLSGRMPFYGRSDVETLRRTALGQYSFPDREWKNISEDAKSLVKGLLQLNPGKRLTAEGALHHKWLNQLENLSTKPIDNDLSQLHSRLRKFRKAARAAMLVERMKDLMNQSNNRRNNNNNNSDRVTTIIQDPGGSNSSSPLPHNNSSNSNNNSSNSNSNGAGSDGGGGGSVTEVVMQSV